jgi:hypothetical protein
MGVISGGRSLSTRSQIRHDLSCGICAISGNGSGRSSLLRERRLSIGEGKVLPGKMLSYTARPIASLGNGFPPFRNASSRLSLCDFMLLFGANLRRGATDPLFIATEAFKALGESEPGTQ